MYFNKDRAQISSFLGGGAPKDTDPLKATFNVLETSFDQSKPPEISDEERDVVTALIRRVLHYDPEKRPSAKELLQDPWFAD
jgi:serine/threonine protein kinase